MHGYAWCVGMMSCDAMRMLLFYLSSIDFAIYKGRRWTCGLMCMRMWSVPSKIVCAQPNGQRMISKALLWLCLRVIRTKRQQTQCMRRTDIGQLHHIFSEPGLCFYLCIWFCAWYRSYIYVSFSIDMGNNSICGLMHVDSSTDRIYSKNYSNG